MMRSKAAAALMRLKEIDRKYNIKRNEGTRAQSNVSTDTSLEGTLMDLPVKARMAPKNVEAPDVGDIENGHRPKVVVSPKSTQRKEDESEYEEDHHAQIIKIDISKKSPRITVDHSSSKASTDVSVNEEIVPINSESLNRPLDPVTPRSTTSSKSKTRDEIRTLESMGHQENVDESSVVTSLTKPSEASEIISEVVRSIRDSSTIKSEKKVTESAERATEDSVKELENDNDQGSIEEVIRISGERSEVISEQSQTQERTGTVSNTSSKEKKHRVEYESDTFEQASTSSASSSNVEERLRENFEEISEDTVRSGVKQIMIRLHGQSKSNQKSEAEESPVDVSEKDKKIIELVPPKIVKSTSECDIDLDEELSNYVRTTENGEEIAPVSLLKLSKQTTPRKHPHRNKRHRKQNENTGSTQKRMESSSEVSDDHERLTRRKENRKEEQVTEENNTATMNTVDEAKDEAKDEKLLEEQSRTEDKEAKDQVLVEDLGSTSSEKLLREIPETSDVTWTLRSLNRDAIDAIARRHKFHTRETKDCRKSGTVKIELPTARIETSELSEGGSRIQSLDNLKEVGQDQKRRRSVRRSSKSSKIKKSLNRSKIEEKQSRIDCKNARRLRKQAVAALRQRQEREDIRNYLLELEHTRLEYGIGDPATTSKLTDFKPLEFPKIAAFVKEDPEETNLMSKDELTRFHERISSIRQWLKDQYILYRDYSSLAKTINAKYVPASLEDAKRTIRQLQKATIKTR